MPHEMNIMNWYKITQEQQEFEEITKQIPPTRSEDEIREDFIEYMDSNVEEVLREFVNSKPGDKQPWPVIPIARVKKIWNDYMQYGFVRDESGMEQIADRIIKNVHRLYANTYLMGHTSGDPTKDFEALGINEDERQRFYWEYGVDETGQARISDYALDDLRQDAFALEGTQTAEEKLQIIDRVFNRIHQRSDLATMFIEGGSESLNELAGRPSEAHAMNWYKKANLDDIPDIAQRMFGLGKYEPKIRYENCPKCGQRTAYYREEHPDTDMNEIVLYCKNCGEIE